MACCTLFPTAPAGGISIAGATTKLKRLCPMAAEFGQPQWAFGGSLYGFASEQQIVCSYTKNGIDYLATLDTATKTLRAIELPFSAISQVRVAADRVVFIGASATETSAIIALDLSTESIRSLAQITRNGCRRRLSLRSASHRIPNRTGPDGTWLFLSAEESATISRRRMKSRRCWS